MLAALVPCMRMADSQILEFAEVPEILGISPNYLNTPIVVLPSHKILGMDTYRYFFFHYQWFTYLSAS